MPGYTPSGLLIKQIHDCLDKQANNSLRDLNLTMMQVSVLTALQESAGKQLSMKELERYFGVAQSTMTGIVSRLEQKGFVEAIGDVSDKRIKVVHITPAGEVCCEKADSSKDNAEKTLLHGFSSEECKQLNTLLTRVLDNFK